MTVSPAPCRINYSTSIDAKSRLPSRPFIYVLPEMIDTQPGHSYVGGTFTFDDRPS